MLFVSGRAGIIAVTVFRNNFPITSLYDGFAMLIP